MGDGAARHRSVRRVTEPFRVMTHHNKGLSNFLWLKGSKLYLQILEAISQFSSNGLELPHQQLNIDQKVFEILLINQLIFLLCQVGGFSQFEQFLIETDLSISFGHFFEVLHARGALMGIKLKIVYPLCAILSICQMTTYPSFHVV